MNVIQLSIVDDLLLFSRGDTILLTILFEIFTTFSKASGLEENEDKSSIYFGGVAQEIQQEIVNILSLVQDTLPIRYLGIPLSSIRTSII